MSREDRKKAIEHNKKLYDYSNDNSINGGVKIDPLPDSDSQIISFDNEDKNWNEFKIR